MSEQGQPIRVNPPLFPIPKQMANYTKSWKEHLGGPNPFSLPKNQSLATPQTL